MPQAAAKWADGLPPASWARGAVMLLMSVVDAGVGGISEGGILIGAIALGSAYGLWPRGK